jgi:hypothetical protein
MSKWIQSAVAGAALVMFTQGALAANQGFYIGVGAAQGFVSDSASLQIDLESDVAYSGIFGYRLGIIPLVDLAAEGFYNDFGEFTPKDGSTNVSAKSWAYGANALAILVAGPVDFYGKVGFANLRYDLTANGTSTTYDSTTPVYGLGIGFRLMQLGFRLQVDNYDTKKDVGDNIMMYSGIVTWTF